MQKIIRVTGMTGMGDNFHQRAVIKSLLNIYDAVILETPWPQAYRDFPGHKLYLDKFEPLGFEVFKTSRKNARQNDHLYSTDIPKETERVHLNYHPCNLIREGGGFLEAMMNKLNIPEEYRDYDFRMNMPVSWLVNSDKWIEDYTKPIMIYKPITERDEWAHSAQRNPLARNYDYLMDWIIRKNIFHVVSVASVGGGEKIVNAPSVLINQEFNYGQLSFADLCSVMSRADVCFTPPGFSFVMAQAIGTPVIGVFGGRESSKMYSLGAKLTKTLAIDTKYPCDCFDDDHVCNKEIDLPTATERIDEFIKGMEL